MMKLPIVPLNSLIEYNSNLIFDGEKIKVFQNNVIDYLYGKKYGKATMKKELKDKKI